MRVKFWNHLLNTDLCDCFSGNGLFIGDCLSSVDVIEVEEVEEEEVEEEGTEAECMCCGKVVTDSIIDVCEVENTDGLGVVHGLVVCGDSGLFPYGRLK